MPTVNVRMMNMTIQTAEFKSVQNWNSTHIADISVGMESQLPYTMFHPMANPSTPVSLPS